MKHAIEVMPLRTAEARERLQALAAADGHDARMMSHALVNGRGEVIGSLGLPTTPTVHFWLSTKLAEPRQTLDVVKLTHGLMSAHGVPAYCIPCPLDSPLYPFAQRMGMGEAAGKYALLYSITRG